MRKASAALGSALFLVLVSGSAAVVVPCRPTGGRRAGQWRLPWRLLGLLPLVAGAAVVLEAFTRFALKGARHPRRRSPRPRGRW
ncbi:hypothetical protein FB563_8122 [Streptomyces puniciscabiei]|uniref:Uncharacterized protein n=1 Tax=Streptomyces puniciscabiei TaxID=164348 RepID=A0A542SXS4_9ACTN|nr:hypothetical protein [Streptomyces puniciscabiei]TQK79411.1 hypothetical protein FB563_8122 [Streptomyces puniciscabiei]